ncbi:MAG TPA: tol-pal system-associated acyl-CoA thioesterase [Micropepsaceae bacterium]|nr:tol-pal system-associated acyl-CoA thioesterase [Micropepsaceae bacterium]
MSEHKAHTHTHVHDGRDPKNAFSGWFEGMTHVLPVRVYYEDTDTSGIVYHANYLRYFERGRSDFLRMAGVHHLVMLQGEDRLAWTIRRINVAYHKPARVDDLLHVRTNYMEMKGARLSGHQSVVRGHDVLATAEIEAAIITLDGRPRRIPADVVEKLAPYVGA